MNNFKVGDRVYHNSFGFGTVKVLRNVLIGREFDIKPTSNIGVEFDKANARFGTISFKKRAYAKPYHGCWCAPSCLKKLTKASELSKENSTIVIKQRDNEIIAYMGKQKATAKCSPTDSFDLYKGTILALTRLLLEGKEE